MAGVLEIKKDVFKAEHHCHWQGGNREYVGPLDLSMVSSKGAGLGQQGALVMVLLTQREGENREHHTHSQICIASP